MDELFIALEAQSDPERAIKMAAYMKNNFPFLGIQKPTLMKCITPYIKALAKEEGINWAFVNACWEKDYREAQYVGIEYLLKVQKKLTSDDLPRLQTLIVTKSWWDTADSIDQLVGYLVQRDSNLFEKMVEWSMCDNLWLRRVSINFQLQYKTYLNTDYLETIICNNFGTQEFFINKAIGWSLREYSKVNPEWVSAFIARHQGDLAALSIKEASKYLKS